MGGFPKQTVSKDGAYRADIVVIHRLSAYDLAIAILSACDHEDDIVEHIKTLPAREVMNLIKSEIRVSGDEATHNRVAGNPEITQAMVDEVLLHIRGLFKYS